MSTQTLIPTTIEPRAAAFAARLGLQGPLSEMVSQLTLNVPGLQSLVVEFAPAYDTGEDGILIQGLRDTLQPAHEQCCQQFSAWKTARFSADVWRHVNLILSCDNCHGG